MSSIDKNEKIFCSKKDSATSKSSAFAKENNKKKTNGGIFKDFF